MKDHLKRAHSYFVKTSTSTLKEKNKAIWQNRHRVERSKMSAYPDRIMNDQDGIRNRITIRFLRQHVKTLIRLIRGMRC